MFLGNMIHTFSTFYTWLPFKPHKEYYIKKHWPITMNSKHLKWANHTRDWFIRKENGYTIRWGNTYDTPLLIGFQVKSYFTLPNSKYKILDFRIRSKWILHNGHYKNQWDKFFHNNIFNDCILRFGSGVGHQVLFIFHKLNLILKHHVGTSMKPHVIGREGGVGVSHDKGYTFWK
jgi:hypothetical protein